MAVEQIIYLEIDDDILIVRDRLRRVQSKHVLLVVPAGCKALVRPLDFRLLRRQAAALGLSLALISDSATLRDMAVEEGITVLSKLSLGQRVVRRESRWRPEDQPGLGGLVARLRRQRPGWRYWVLGPLVVALVLGVFAWAFFMIWPSATVTVVQSREPIGISTWVEASITTRGVDWDRLTMPARVVQTEVVDRGEVNTTGITNVAADKAVGTVLFVNSTMRDVSIPVDTIVSTSAGTSVRFRTTLPGTVESRGRVRVPVEAVEGGPGGNVPANLINRIEGGLEASLKVTNESGTSGGASEQVHRVTHGDKQRVSDLLREKLLQKAHAELSDLLEGEFLPFETMQINEYSIRTNYDQHVDDQSDTLALEMRGVVWGFAVSQEAADEMTRRALAKQIREGFRLLPGTVHIAQGGSVEVDRDAGSVRFLVEGVALMEARIDEPLVREAIRGRSIEEALAYLQQALPVETSPTLRVHPDWMNRVPWMAFRINFVRGQLLKEIAYALPRT